MDHMQTVRSLWAAIGNQNWSGLASYFTDSAVIRWHNTRELFTASEFVEANSRYPGDWLIEVERLLEMGDAVISVVKASLKGRSVSFHAVSFFTFEGERIAALDEYWGDDGSPPQWRTELRIGKQMD